jgi:hypothetical protein
VFVCIYKGELPLSFVASTGQTEMWDELLVHLCGKPPKNPSDGAKEVPPSPPLHTHMCVCVSLVCVILHTSMYVYIYIWVYVYGYTHTCLYVHMCYVLIRPPIPYITSSRCKRLHKIRPEQFLLHKRANTRTPL